MVFTISNKNKAKTIRNAILTKTPIIEIGHVTKGKGVFIEKNKKLERLQDLGWRHLKK